MKKVSLYLLISVFLIISCTGKNPLLPTTPDEKPKSAAPVAGNNGTITITSTEKGTIEISWQQASDDNTTVENLQYKVYYSTSDNINTPELAQTNGQTAKDWTANITTCSITDLTGFTTYYINVVVKDEDSNKTAYQTVSGSISIDSTPPVTAKIEAVDPNYTSIQVNWTTATDNTTQKENLQYKLVYSTDQTTINTAEMANSNGKTALSWNKNVYAKTVSSLNYSTTYYFALIVKDEAGNIALYNVVSARTKQFETKVYFQNGMWSYYITNIEARHSTSDSWTNLRSGYPYINPTQDRTYSCKSPKYTITKDSYYFRYKVVSHNWATKYITGLQPGKIYRILLYDNTFSYYKLEIVGTY